MTTKAQLKATKKYQAANYEGVTIRLPKGERDKFKQFARELGLSLREYIRMACYEKHERTKKKEDP